MRAGQHAGACTFLAEVSHKRFIKTAAKLGRTYGSHNRTEGEMLKWNLRDMIYSTAARKAKRSTDAFFTNVSSDDDEDSEGFITRTFTEPLALSMSTKSAHFRQLRNRSVLRKSWERKMISEKCRVTRRELLDFVCEKLGIRNSRETRTDLVLMKLELVCRLTHSFLIKIHICI